MSVLPTRREKEVEEAKKETELVKKELQKYRDKFGELR